MKARVVYLIGFVIVVLMAADAMAQRGRGYESRGDRPFNQPGRFAEAAKARRDLCADIGSLNQEQLEKNRELQLKRQEQSIQHRAALDELRARKRRLMIEQEPSLGEVNRVIDQMTAHQAIWMKESAAHHQEIRNMLSEEQRIIFDSRTANRPMMRQLHRRGQEGFQPAMGRGRR